MIIRKVLYLIAIVLCALVMALGYMVLSLPPILLIAFPGALLMFCACLRLYMFTGELFDPYTCLSESAPAVFKKWFYIVYVFSVTMGSFAVLCLWRWW